MSKGSKHGLHVIWKIAIGRSESQSPLFTQTLNPVFATRTYSSDRSAQADRCTTWRIQLLVTEITYAPGADLFFKLFLCLFQLMQLVEAVPAKDALGFH
jgi:hypothetical protein